MDELGSLLFNTRKSKISFPPEYLKALIAISYYKFYRLEDSDTSEESTSEESESEGLPKKRRIMPLFTEEEERKLPMFNHEENPPASEDSEDEDNFINDEDESDTGGSDSVHSEDSENKSDNSESYINPYLERNNELEHQDIMEILSKSTEKDKSNKKRYYI